MDVKMFGSYESLIGALLLMGKDGVLNWRDGFDGNGGIHICARMGKEDCLGALLDAGADVNARNDAHFTPLHFASEAGAVKCVELLILCRADVNAQTGLSNTPLHLCLGYPQCTRSLLAARARLDVVNVNGQTPLARALLSGDVESGELLLDGGAKLALLPRNIRVPAWVREVAQRRSNCAHTCVVLMGVLRR